VGASVNYGTWIEEFGAGACVNYSVNNKIDIVANGTYFLPHKVNVEYGTNEFTWWMVNLDGHYIVFEKEMIQFYGLMGLNFTNETKRIEETVQGQLFKDKIVTTKIGLNTGAGVQFPISKFFIPFTEARYTLGERQQFCFSLGFLFRIAPDKIRDEID
jgi:opacity protein-like surface antigen